MSVNTGFALSRLAVQRGLITAEQLDKAMKGYTLTLSETSLENYLVSTGYLSEDHIGLLHLILEQGDAGGLTQADGEVIEVAELADPPGIHTLDTMHENYEPEGRVFPAAGTEPPSNGRISGVPQQGMKDKYELLDEINRGGMGVIFRARQKSLDRILALKVMLSSAFASPKARQRFMQEAHTLAQLQHPNIIRVYDSGEYEDTYYFAMDYIDGMDLSDYARENRAILTPTKKLEMIAKVLDAVHYGHEQGIVHRDLKPANIMIDQHHEPIVMDFGIAKIVAETDEDEVDNKITAEGDVIGTPQYMAPEQAAGRSKAIGPRTDVFAMGIITYELLCGKLPFNGNDVHEIMNAIFVMEPVSPLKHNRDLNWEIEAIILKAMEKAPRERYQSAFEMKADIYRYLAGEPIQAKRISTLYYLRKKIKRHKVVASLLFLIFLMVLGALGYLGYEFFKEQQAIFAERNAEEERIAAIHKVNEKLENDIHDLLDANEFSTAREKRVKIEDGLARIKGILADSKVASEDSRNYIRVWELTSAELAIEITRREKESKIGQILERCNQHIEEGHRLLKAAGAVLADTAGADARNEAKTKIQDAIFNFDAALKEISDLEGARSGKFNACRLMGESSIDDRAFDVSNLYLQVAGNIAASEEEKKTIEDLLTRQARERGQLQKYEGYLNKGRDLFAKNDFNVALSSFEAGRQVFDTPEIREAIQLTTFKIELARADMFRDNSRFFEAAEAYRKALPLAREAFDRANIRQLIETMIARGIAARLADINTHIKNNRLEKADRIVDQILALEDNGEARRIKGFIQEIRTVPPDMIFVKGGEFQKGTHEETVGNPLEKTNIPDFYIGKFEVTNTQFRAFVVAGGYDEKKYWTDAGWKLRTGFTGIDGVPGPGNWQKGLFPSGTDDQPVSGISFHEAQAYQRWYAGKTNRPYALPDELQWEKAASWSDEDKLARIYPWGDEWTSEKGQFGETVGTIGSNAADTSPYGCMDMGGNVNEWVKPVADTATAGIIKGGGARLPQPIARAMAKASSREAPPPEFRGERVGFRLVLQIRNAESK
ncbi:protein kinase [Planctomycetota bacterium]